MGHPAYVIKSGEVLWKGHDLLKLSADKRARLGMFLAFQYPMAIPGLSVASFLRSAINARRAGPESRSRRSIPPTPSAAASRWASSASSCARRWRCSRWTSRSRPRYVNEGFSGGEKKRLEMLQMAVLEPEMAILDETDSGLDIDALRIVAEGVNAMLNPNMGVLVITHYQRLLNYITPDEVHVLAAGRIITSGGKDLALRLEEEGYAPILAEAGLEGEVGDEAPTARLDGQAPMRGRRTSGGRDRWAAH